MELGALVCTAAEPALRRLPGRRPVRLARGRPPGVRRAAAQGADLGRHRPAVPRPAARGAARQRRPGAPQPARRRLGRGAAAGALPGLAWSRTACSSAAGADTYRAALTQRPRPVRRRRRPGRRSREVPVHGPGGPERAPCRRSTGLRLTPARRPRAASARRVRRGGRRGDVARAAPGGPRRRAAHAVSTCVLGEPRSAVAGSRQAHELVAERPVGDERVADRAVARRLAEPPGTVLRRRSAPAATVRSRTIDSPSDTSRSAVSATTVRARRPDRSGEQRGRGVSRGGSVLATARPALEAGASTARRARTASASCARRDRRPAAEPRRPCAP